MRLSEAMMLGSVTCKMVPNDWNSCALGCSGNAVGIPEATPKTFFGSDQICPDGRVRIEHIAEVWPWLNDRMGNFAIPEGNLVCGMEAVWSRFDFQVCTGAMTLEQLSDYVRSIEPECGDCCRFECTCKPTEVPEMARIEVAK